MSRFQLEVAIETPADAVIAEKAGADRVELSAALDLGGLTPTPGMLREVIKSTKLPVWVMLRPRSGDFVYDLAELKVMFRDAKALRKFEPAGFVFGVLNEDGTIAAEHCRDLIATCGTPCVMHRAFDRCPDPAAALETAVEVGFARILTSGRELTAVAGSHAIKELHKLAAGRIEILPCGKIRSANAESVLEMTGCDQVHGSFAESIPVGVGAGRRGYPTRTRVGFEDLNETRAVLTRLAAARG